MAAPAVSIIDETRPSRVVRRARAAIALIFAVHGCVTGSFAARIPWIASHVGVGVGRLGVALVMPSVGALLAMPFFGRLVHRYTLRPLTTVMIVAWCVALVAPTLPTSLVGLCVVLVAFGAIASLADMAMNAGGVLVNRLYGRSVISSIHGFWSVGVLAGAVISALASHVGIGAPVQFAVEALMLAGLGAGSAQLLLNYPPTVSASAPPHFALPTRPVLLIGLVGLCAIFGEQAGNDWSALYIRNELGGSTSVAALAVGAFALSMASARLVGDRLIRRVGAVTSVRISGACATAGAVTIVIAPDLPAGLAGFALLGMGVALVIPLVFAAAESKGPHPARSVAGVAGVAYAGGLAAPGVIGGLASATSLATSFCLVAGLVAIMTAGARVLRGGQDLG